jgi:hypothetical protein
VKISARNLADLWRPLDSLLSAGGVTTICYAIWYPYVSMRRYYGQGRELVRPRDFPGSSGIRFPASALRSARG